MPPKVATRSSLEHVMTLDILLRSTRGTSMERMTSAMDCCEKTVRRHLAWMAKKIGMRIVRTRRGWWRYADGQQPLFTDYARRRLAR